MMIGREKYSKELFSLLITVLSIAIFEVQAHRIRKEIIKVNMGFWQIIDGKITMIIVLLK